MKALRSARYVSVLFVNAGLMSACGAHGGEDKTSAISSNLVVESAACKIEYDIPSVWDTGFTGNVIVTNKGAAIGSWKLEWDFTGAQSVSSAWNASATQTGSHVTVNAESWNGALASGANTSFGFNGAFSGSNPSPTNFKLNGVACSGGASAPSTPPASTPPASGGTSAPPSSPPPSSGTTSQTGSSSSGSCSAPAYAAGTSYAAGAQVQSGGSVYACKPYPFTGWCGLGGAYTPGTGSNWQDAWTLVGACSGGTAPSSPPPPPSSPPPSSPPPSSPPPSSPPPSSPPPSSPPPSSPLPPSASGFSAIVSEGTFNSMFPSRNGFYTYQGLVSAIGSYPAFATSGSSDAQKQEAAAFLANVAHETGGLVYTEEIAKDVFCQPTPSCPCAAGQEYYGRGPIQLSWNYNYCAAGQALGLALQSNPGLVSSNATVAWQTGLWFWMTQTGAVGTTAHNAMVSGSGFGTTIRVINGGLECNGANAGEMQDRVNYYTRFCSMLGVSPGANTGC